MVNIQISYSINKASNKNQHFKTIEKVHKKVKKSKEFQSLIPTPKPWVAGSNPPAPAITEAKRLRFFSFWYVLFCISLSKAKMTKFFNAFRSKNPFSFSVVSVYSNLSVCCSIKKAATVSTELQKSVRATADFSLSAVALLFVYTDAIFDVL